MKDLKPLFFHDGGGNAGPSLVNGFRDVNDTQPSTLQLHCELTDVRLQILDVLTNQRFHYNVQFTLKPLVVKIDIYNYDVLTTNIKDFVSYSEFFFRHETCCIAVSFLMLNI